MIKSKSNLNLILLIGLWGSFFQIDPAMSSSNDCSKFIDGAPKLSSNKKEIVCSLTSDYPLIFYNSFYKYGLSYEESLRPFNQFANLFGLSFKNGLNFSFPEQRISHDGHLLCKTFNKLLDEQSLSKSVYTEDISNGYNSSMGIIKANKNH